MTGWGFKPAKPCPCGSGKDRHELVDARGIFCCFYCDKCEAEKRARYRPDVLTDPNYWADEPIDDPT
jgi:hypothetical protein